MLQIEAIKYVGERTSTNESRETIMHVSARKRVRNICLRVNEAEWRQDRSTACLCVWQEMRVQTEDMGALFPSQKQ